MSQDVKATAIDEALYDADIDASLNPGPPLTDDVADTQSITFKAESGEKDKYIASIGPGSGSGYAQIGYALLARFAGLSGVDSGLGAATYSAGFEFVGPSFGNIVLTADLAFADRLVPTIDGLVQQQFALFHDQLLALAPSLSGFLALDLVTSPITFAPLGYFATVVASNGTTDIALASRFTVAVVPEPPTVPLMFVAMLCALYCWRGRRALGPR